MESAGFNKIGVNYDEKTTYRQTVRMLKKLMAVTIGKKDLGENLKSLWKENVWNMYTNKCRCCLIRLGIIP
jgi:hypothetical protein